MAVGEAVAGAVQGLGSIGLGIYNAWRTQRNQQIQWQREDTALQRRVKDAEAAGFNKWSQLASGASSNTTVTAGTADSGMAGAVADALSSMYKIATERESAKLAKQQRIIAENQAKVSKNNVLLNNWNTALSVAGLMRDAGFDVPYIALDKDSDGARNPTIVWNFTERSGDTMYPRANAPWYKAWDLDYQSLQNEAEKLQTDTDWQKTNYVVNLLSKIFGAGSQAAGAVSRFRRPKK